MLTKYAVFLFDWQARRNSNIEIPKINDIALPRQSLFGWKSGEAENVLRNAEKIPAFLDGYFLLDIIRF